MTKSFQPERVFLIVAPPPLIDKATTIFADLGGTAHRPFAWSIPWRGTLDALRWRLIGISEILGTTCVITELNGGDFFA